MDHLIVRGSYREAEAGVVRPFSVHVIRTLRSVWIIGAIVVSTAGMVRAAESSEPLQMIVMDPLALPLSCTCVEGTGQRRYDILAEFIANKIGRPVKVTFEESINLALIRTGGKADVIIGKRSMVLFDAKYTKLRVRPIAALTGKDGSTGLHGVFLVRKDNPAKTLADLAGGKILLGPVEDADTHAAALAALAKAGVKNKLQIDTAGSIDAAAIAVVDREADAAVVSAFMLPLLEGCGKLERNSVRIIGRTSPVAFVEVFVTEAVSNQTAQKLAAALYAVRGDAQLLKVMESQNGFIPIAEPGAAADPSANAHRWTDWRGAGRAGLMPNLPSALPNAPKRLWSAKLTGPAMAGPAATDRHVIVPDKSADFATDIFRCLDAATGREVWTLEYAAPEEIDYSNAPRATPVLQDGLVYLLGAAGHLHCVELTTGKVKWAVNLFHDFGAHELLTWGTTSAPLVVDQMLIINPGAAEASVVALDRLTGRVIWKSPGHPAAYSAFIAGRFGGRRQIIGYDVAGIGGWDPKTGQRLWEVIPTEGTDFNVTTPIIVDDKLLLATENNATRLYAFDSEGKLQPRPIAVNDDLAPDTCTPVVINGRIFATGYGKLYCLDLTDGLKTVYHVEDDMFYDHVNITAGNNRVLIWTMAGDLLLISADADQYKLISGLRPFGPESLDSMAHPAMVGDLLYLRSKNELICLRIGGQ